VGQAPSPAALCRGILRDAERVYARGLSDNASIGTTRRCGQKPSTCTAVVYAAEDYAGAMQLLVERKAIGRVALTM
jgi:hypothetical protein